MARFVVYRVYRALVKKNLPKNRKKKSTCQKAYMLCCLIYIDIMFGIYNKISTRNVAMWSRGTMRQCQNLAKKRFFSKNTVFPQCDHQLTQRCHIYNHALFYFIPLIFALLRALYLLRKERSSHHHFCSAKRFDDFDPLPGLMPSFTSTHN